VAKQGLSVTVTVVGLKQARAALNKLPDDGIEEMKDASFNLSKQIAQRIKGAASARGHQAALMAGTVTWGTNTGKDSIFPEVQAGGSARVGRLRKPAYALLFGSEFGVGLAFRSGWYGKGKFGISVGRQYGPRNQLGYWFFPTVEALNDQIAHAWAEAADRVIEKFGEE
jgi:hypothetical protein